MIESVPALDRVRRIRHWSPAREPRALWLRASGDLALTSAIAFRCLGVERIYLQLEPGRERGAQPSRGLRQLQRWSEGVRLELVPGDPHPLALELMLESRDIDVVVDAGGDDSLVLAAQMLEIPCYSVAASGTRLALADENRVADTLGTELPQLEAAFALAGLVSHDFAWRHILDPAPPLPGRAFDLDLSHAFLPDGAREALADGVLDTPRSLLLMGAGGLSCPAGLCVSRRLPRGSKVVVADFDSVDATNSRQFLYRRADIRAARPKARAFCREMERIAPQIAWVPEVRALPHPAIYQHAPFDAALAFTDTLASRAALDAMEIAPLLVHAGVDAESATAGVFHRGSVSLTEALGLEQAAANEQGRASCADADPSIVSTNFIGAALALAELWSQWTHGLRPAELASYEISSAARGGRWPVQGSAPTGAPATTPPATAASASA